MAKPERKIVCLCSSCGEDFGGVTAFDLHRVGKHDYTYEEGLQMSPPREDGRRCLSREEMVERKLKLDAYGRWRAPGRNLPPWERAAAAAAAEDE